MDMYQKIVEKIASTPIVRYGVADLNELKSQYPDMLDIVGSRWRFSFTFGIPLPRGALIGLKDKPTVLYFHHYRQLNYLLDRLGFEIALLIECAGYKALAIAASQIISHSPLPRGHISHKLLGYAAGLGWLGRNNLLIDPDYGARLRYASVLTDAPLPPCSPLDTDCGDCRKCIEVCPAGAIKEDRLQFDLAACNEQLKQFSKIQFIGQQICGICVKACTGK